MTVFYQNRLPYWVKEERWLSIAVFSIFFSWVLAFPFEGQILYSLADQHQVEPRVMVFCAIAFTFLGLFSGGFLISNILKAKRFILLSILVCMLVTAVFFFPPSILWTIAISVGSYFGGASVAVWGFFYKNGTPPNERIKTAASGLIYSNILMIALNMVAVHVSPVAGLTACMAVLAVAFFLSLLLPESEISKGSGRKEPKAGLRIERPLLFLCFFIVVITINSGLMYQVINPAYAQYEWLVSWYWAVPYIVALYIMKNLPRKTNRTYILFVGIAMIGFAFLYFMYSEHTISSYFVVDTLMLGACGVYDLFWWSILGEMLDWSRNPARILGIGLSANVFGVLLGGLIGNGIISSDLPYMNASMLALAVVFLTLILLPVLNKHLTAVLKDHAYLTVYSELTFEERKRAAASFGLDNKLTEREKEITALLLDRKTVKMIAQELYLSENTVKTHIKNIYSKLNVQNRMELLSLLLDPQYKNRI